MTPGFYIDHADWTKILNYAKARQGQKAKDDKTKILNHEIGGMLIAKLDKDEDWVLQDAVILKQETAGANCTLDRTALADYYIEMVEKHGRDIQFIWWHSHATMKAFWSGTDTATMKEYASGQWSMFLVVNIKGEYKFRVQMWEPIEAGEDIELGFINAPDDSIPKDIIEEVAAKCTEESYATYGTSWRDRYSTNGAQRSSNGSQLSLGANGSETIDAVAYSQSAYQAHEELKDYNKGFNVYDDEELAIDYIIKRLDSLNEKLCKGEIKHKEYRKSVKSINLKMEKGFYTYRIILPKADHQLDLLIQASFAWDMIVDTDTGETIESTTAGVACV